MKGGETVRDVKERNSIQLGRGHYLLSTRGGRGKKKEGWGGGSMQQVRQEQKRPTGEQGSSRRKAQERAEVTRAATEGSRYE